MVQATPIFAPGAQLTFDYGVRAELLPNDLAASFLRMHSDTALEQFVARTRAERAGALKTLAFKGLQRLVSDYDAYATLRMYRMHLLSTEQWAALIAYDGVRERKGLLDIGAGDGAVTHFARPLFEHICVTESARSLARLLRRNGFRVEDHDLGSAPWPIAERFDVVSVLNVIDRTLHPRTLLRHARDLLAPGGRLVVSVPLPLAPHVHVGARTVDPEESLPSAGESFEAGATSVVSELFAPLGLRVERWTRLPYVSHGDQKQPLYVLDASVFVCRS